MNCLYLQPKINFELQKTVFRVVAQPGRVHVWGACGRRFKSCPPDTNKFSKYIAQNFTLPHENSSAKSIHSR